MTWDETRLKLIANTDDLKISPFRDDGVTCGTPTWIWSVVVDGDLYLRGYNGKKSRWHQAAVHQTAGRISAARMAIEVSFDPVDGAINDRIDDAYRAKYAKSSYLVAMIGERARSATVKITPRFEEVDQYAETHTWTKAKVSTFIESLELRSMDAGPLAIAWTLEHGCMLCSCEPRGRLDQSKIWIDRTTFWIASMISVIPGPN